MSAAGPPRSMLAGAQQIDTEASALEQLTAPVRYDPADHSKVEIDMPALKASHAAKRAAENDRAIDEAEKRVDSDE